MFDLLLDEKYLCLWKTDLSLAAIAVDVYVTELSLVLLLLCARGGILSNELNTLHQETTGAFWFSAEQQ